MVPGDHLNAFTRATTATYQFGPSPPGLALAASGTPRHHHFIGARRTLLIEGQRTNVVENSDAESDAVGWGIQAGSTVTRVATKARLGSWGIEVVTTNADGAGFYLHRRSGGNDNFAASVGQVWTFSVPIFAGAGAIGKQLRARLDWRDGTNTTISTTDGATVALVAGWQTLTVTGTAPASTAGVFPIVHTNGAQGVFTFWADVPNLEQAPFASSAIPTTTAAATRNGDIASVAMPFVPQEMWVYCRFVELGTILMPTGSFSRIWDISASFPNNYMAVIRSDGGVYVAEYGQTSTITSSSALSAAPVLNDVVELLVTLSATGQVQIHQSINGAAPASGGLGNANGFGAAWNTPTMYIGSANGSSPAFAAYERLCIGRGSLGSGANRLIAKARGIAG